MSAAANLHGGVVLLDSLGVLIRGASGAGKSRLALDLVDRWRLAGRFAAIVADDRVEVTAAGGRLVARAPAALAGLVELRGCGILRVEAEPAAVLRLVIDLADSVDRLPSADALETTILGVRLARLAVRSADPRAAAVVTDAILGRFATMDQ